MNKEEALLKLKVLRDRGQPLIDKNSSEQNFKKWRRDTEVAVERIFGNGTRHMKDFQDVRYSLSVISTSTPDSDFVEAFQSGIRSAITVIDSFIDEITEYWSDEIEDKNSSVSADPLTEVKLIIKKFHQVARQLRSRYLDRATIEIEDEYDVQDLFHSLLKLYFDDIRAEEYTPSYAGAASRVDFLLKQEQVIIEVKKTRKGLGAKELGEQLIIDSQRYQVHPDCNQLICFVYDPEGRIANPRGIEKDLTKIMNDIPIFVFIVPE